MSVGLYATVLQLWYIYSETVGPHYRWESGHRSWEAEQYALPVVCCCGKLDSSSLQGHLTNLYI